MGEAEFARRKALEDHVRARRGEGQGKGLFRIEGKIDIYGIIKRCLQISGFWKRAHRNYFDVQVVHREWFFSRLPREFNGLRILHLTDLHADLHPDFADSVVSTLKGVECDCVVVTGDFRACTFSDHTGATAASVQILGSLNAPAYLTLGNHDSIRKVPEFEVAGFPFLLNEHIKLKRQGAEIYLIGIDDPNFYKSHSFAHALKGVPKDAFKIVLSHSPQTYKEAEQYGADFMVSGHTHGGQICLPFGIPIVHDGSAPRRFLAGPWKEGNLQGYTGRGTGATGLPVRLNCPAEATVHTLFCK